MKQDESQTSYLSGHQFCSYLRNQLVWSYITTLKKIHFDLPEIAKIWPCTDTITIKISRYDTLSWSSERKRERVHFRVFQKCGPAAPEPVVQAIAVSSVVRPLLRPKCNLRFRQLPANKVCSRTRKNFRRQRRRRPLFCCKGSIIYDVCNISGCQHLLMASTNGKRSFQLFIMFCTHA